MIAWADLAMSNLYRTICRCALLLLVVTSGCASWHTSEEKQLSRALPAPRRHPGGAVLEVAFVSIQPPKPVASDRSRRSRRDQTEAVQASTEELVDDAQISDVEIADVVADDLAEVQTFDLASLVASEDSEQTEEVADESPTPEASVSAASAAGREQEDIWQWIDETVVVPEVRQALRRNGLRLGRVQGAASFTERLNRIRRNPGPTSDVLEIAEVESDLSHQARLITCRIGKRYELPVRQPSAGEQAVLVTLGGKTVGQTLSQAQPLFALRATAADVNSIRLLLRPEIQHGAARQTWVGSDAALRIDNRRASWTFEELAAEVPLEKGGILVAGCTYPAFGLGQQMFTGTTADGDDDQVLMVIRVADLPELIDR